MNTQVVTLKDLRVGAIIAFTGEKVSRIVLQPARGAIVFLKGRHGTSIFEASFDSRFRIQH